MAADRRPNGARLTIREIETSPIGVNPTRLGLPGRVQPSIPNAFRPRPGVGVEQRLGEIERPELVHTGHRDVQDAVLEHDIPRRTELDGPGLPRAGIARPRLPGPGDRLDPAGCEIDLADDMVPGIGHVEDIAGQRLPCGWLNRAVAAGPSANPGCPLPMVQGSAPSSRETTIRL